MTNIWNKLRFALPVVAGACLLAPLASARTIAAVAGNPAIGSNSSCFNDLISPGVRNTCAAGQSWDTVVPFDNPAAAGVKRLIARGTGNLSCTFFATDLAGVAAGSVALPINVATALPVINGGTFGRVRCTVGASSTGSFLGTDLLNP